MPLTVTLLQVSITIFLTILIPIYWKSYGWRNFLWFSDIGLFLTFFIVWLNSALLTSMAMIGILPFELVWTVDYVLHLAGYRAIGITNYMFDSKYSKSLRALSLFHLALPVIWIFYLIKLGYDPKAFMYQTLLFWTVIIISYLVTDPKENVNWVYQPHVNSWQKISPLTWMIAMLILFPIIVFYPLHLLLSTLF